MPPTMDKHVGAHNTIEFQSRRQYEHESRGIGDSLYHIQLKRSSLYSIQSIALQPSSGSPGNVAPCSATVFNVKYLEGYQVKFMPSGNVMSHVTFAYLWPHWYEYGIFATCTFMPQGNICMVNSKEGSH